MSNLISLIFQFIEYSSGPSKTKILSSLQEKIQVFQVQVGVDILHRKLSIMIAEWHQFYFDIVMLLT